MIDTPASHSGRRTILRERAFVFAGPGIALIATVVALGFGVGIRFIEPI